MLFPKGDGRVLGNSSRNLSQVWTHMVYELGGSGCQRLRVSAAGGQRPRLDEW